MPFRKEDEDGNLRVVTPLEFDVERRRELVELEAPARKLATKARNVLRERPGFLEDDEGTQTAGLEAMSCLSEAFHVLQGAAGVRPWDLETLYHHAFSPAATEASRHAIRFLLTLWNRDAIASLDAEFGRELGAFSSVDALACWDAGNRAAYVTWASDPWWP